VSVTYARKAFLRLTLPTMLAVVGGLALHMPSAEAAPITLSVMPTMTAPSPQEGPDTGGTAFTITGSGMTGITTVRFQDPSYTAQADASVTNTGTQLTGITPAASWSGVTYITFLNASNEVTLYSSGGPSSTAMLSSFSYCSGACTGGGGGGGSGSGGGGGGTTYDWESANSPTNPAWLPKPVTPEPPRPAPALSELTLSQLATASATRFVELTALEFSRFQPEQMRQLQPAQVAVVPPQAFSSITPPQFAGLQPPVFQVMSIDQLDAIPPPTLATMSAAQFANMGEDTLLNMTGEVLGSLPPSLLATLSPKQASQLNPEALASLTPEQLKAIPAPSLRALRFSAKSLLNLTPGEVGNWVKAGVFESMSKKELADSIKGMSPEAAAALFTDPTKLPAEAIAAMSPEQVAKMPVSVIAKLNVDQLAAFTPAQVKRMSVRQLREFNVERPCTDRRVCVGRFSPVEFMSDEAASAVERRLRLG